MAPSKEMECVLGAFIFNVKILNFIFGDEELCEWMTKMVEVDKKVKKLLRATKRKMGCLHSERTWHIKMLGGKLQRSHSYVIFSNGKVFEPGNKKKILETEENHKQKSNLVAIIYCVNLVHQCKPGQYETFIPDYIDAYCKDFFRNVDVFILITTEFYENL